MASDRQSSGLVWAALSAVGGLLSGIGAVLGLFMTKPSVITIFVPPAVLQRALDEASPTTATALIDPAQPPLSGNVPPQNPPAQSAQQAPPSVQTTPRNLGDDVSVAVVSVADDANRFIVTLRFANQGSNNIGVAVSRNNSFGGDFLLTDGVGGSCPLVANGEGLGSLGLELAVVPDYMRGIGSSDFRIIAAQGAAQHTLLFNKSRCDTQITSRAALALAGAFVLLNGDVRRMAPASFENLSIPR